MFHSKALFLTLFVEDGKRGWTGTLRQWELAREYSLMQRSLQAMKQTFKQIWR